MLYAQIIDNQINLIGAEDVGLPLSAEILATKPYAQCIEISSLPQQPQVGHYYKDGKFYTPEEYAVAFPPEPVTPEPYQPNNAEIAQQISELYAQMEIRGVI